nr:hypothetical protein CFP56_23797 [Quercus suber]
MGLVTGRQHNSPATPYIPVHVSGHRFPHRLDRASRASSCLQHSMLSQNHLSTVWLRCIREDGIKTGHGRDSLRIKEDGRLLENRAAGDGRIARYVASDHQVPHFLTKLCSICYYGVLSDPRKVEQQTTDTGQVRGPVYYEAPLLDHNAQAQFIDGKIREVHAIKAISSFK